MGIIKNSRMYIRKEILRAGKAYVRPSTGTRGQSGQPEGLPRDAHESNTWSNLPRQLFQMEVGTAR